MSVDIRQRVHNILFIEPFLVYGCRARTTNKPIQKKTDAADVWFWRRMLRIPWTPKKTEK